MTEPRSRWRDGFGLAGRRVAQAVLDGLVVVLPMLLLAIVAIVVYRPSGFADLLRYLKVVVFAMLGLDLLGAWLLSVWWPHRHGGQTPAMRWLRLRVVTLDGGQPSLGALFLRQLLMVVDGFAWGLVGIVLIVCTGRHQRLGDVVTRTAVVRMPPKPADQRGSADEAGLPSPDGDLGAIARP